jgi:hypothetical protein
MDNTKTLKGNLIPYWAAILVGTTLVFWSLLRAIGLNNLYVATSTGDINRSWASSIVINWGMSSFLLFLVGIWLFFLAPELKKRIRRARFQALIIGIALTLYGGTFWLQFPHSFHLPGFLILGLVLAISLLIPGRALVIEES